MDKIRERIFSIINRFRQPNSDNGGERNRIAYEALNALGYDRAAVRRALVQELNNVSIRRLAEENRISRQTLYSVLKGESGYPPAQEALAGAIGLKREEFFFDEAR